MPLVAHDKLIALAEAIFGTEDIRIYEAELWAKYSGAAGYEQEHHRDYLNHTPLVPSASDLRWRGLEVFIWLSDVPEDHGPTHVVPLPVTVGVPALPNGYPRSERPDFYEHEQSGAGPAGTVVAYSTDTFHRGTEITALRSARCSAKVSYRHADNFWASRHAWGERSFHPDRKPFVEQATMRQLLLFGFPPPGHPYWTPETIEGLRVRYPGVDTRQWRPEAAGRELDARTRTTALRRERMPGELDRSLALPGWDGASAGRGLPRPEPGAGSAEPGTAQRRRLI